MFMYFQNFDAKIYELKKQTPNAARSFFLNKIRFEYIIQKSVTLFVKILL